MASSIQFGTDNRTPVSTDGQALNRAINPAISVDTGHGAAQQVRVNQSGFASMNFGSGAATSGTGTAKAQLVDNPNKLVPIGNTSTKPAVVETLKSQAPELFEPVENRMAREAVAEAQAKAEEAARIELNTHPVEEIEAAHLHFLGEVDRQDQTALLVQLWRDGAPNEATLHRVAEAMGVTVEQAVDKLNAVTMGTSAQLAALCRSEGVDPEAFGQWMRTTRLQDSLKAIQVHTQDRNLVAAWSKHVKDFQRSGR